MPLELPEQHLQQVPLVQQALLGLVAQLVPAVPVLVLAPLLVHRALEPLVLEVRRQVLVLLVVKQQVAQAQVLRQEQLVLLERQARAPALPLALAGAQALGQELALALVAVRELVEGPAQPVEQGRALEPALALVLRVQVELAQGLAQEPAPVLMLQDQVVLQVLQVELAPLVALLAQIPQVLAPEAELAGLIVHLMQLSQQRQRQQQPLQRQLVWTLVQSTPCPQCHRQVACQRPQPRRQPQTARWVT